MNLVDDLNKAISLIPANQKGSGGYKKEGELSDLRDWLLTRNIYSISDLEKQFKFCLWTQESDLIRIKHEIKLKYEKTN